MWNILFKINPIKQNLSDLIRGIRANRNHEESYISMSLNEIRDEVKNNDPDIKALAIAKLFYVTNDSILDIQLI